MRNILSAPLSALAALAIAGISASALAAPAERPARASDKPTIVLVHGAFAESASWNGVVARLEKDGYAVIAAPNPLRGVQKDAQAVGSVVRSVHGPVVLVGHSYAGEVISDPEAAADNVKALVYVAAFAPDAGESASQLVARFPGSTLGPTLAPPVPLAEGGKDLFIRQDKFPAQFAADVPLAQARLMAASQRPIAAAALEEPARAPAWKRLPSWFVYGAADRNIPPAAQAFMARRAGARETTVVPGASHVVMISHPEAVAAVIEHAAQAGLGQAGAN